MSAHPEEGRTQGFTCLPQGVRESEMQGLPVGKEAGRQAAPGASPPTAPESARDSQMLAGRQNGNAEQRRRKG